MYHVLPLIRRRADKDNIAETVRRNIAGVVITYPGSNQAHIFLHGRLTLSEIAGFFFGSQNIIRNCVTSFARIIAVLQARRHKFDFVLVPRDLC